MKKYWPEKPWLALATFFLLASIATLWLKKPTLFFSKTNLNDLLLLVSFVFFIIASWKDQLSIRIERKWLIAALVAIGTLILGSLISAIFFDTFFTSVIREYARIFASLIIAWEIYTIGRSRTLLAPTILYLIAAPAILLPFVFYYSPALSFFLDDSQSRFTGFLLDPNYYASLALFPAFVLLWIANEFPLGKKIWLSAISLFLFALTVGSIIWSGSRGGVLGLLIGLLVLFAFMLIKLPFKTASLKIGIILVACAMTYFLLPNMAQKHIAARMGGIKEYSSITHETSEKFTSRFTGNQGRFTLWQNSIHEIRKNPLGYGPEYGPITNIHDVNNQEHKVAHNTLLQIPLTGGIGLVVVFCIALFAFLKKTLTARLAFGEVHYLTASLIAIAVTALFLDSLWSRWIWVIIGLILVYLHHEHVKKVA